MSEQAAAWIRPGDETERGNQLGAAIVAAERKGRSVTRILEGGADQREAAIGAARETGLLILPEVHQVLPQPGEPLELLRRSRSDGWRLMMLSAGIDTGSRSGEVAERLLDVGAASFETPQVDVPVPPARLRRRVAVGTESVFLSTGLMHVKAYDGCLTAAGAPVAEASELLDWGAGCGRMTIHLRERAPRARITAADTDAEAIAWVAEHLDVAAAVTLPLTPPSELDDEAFDRVVGHSIFTHLEVDAQDRWLEELARVTRPGAFLAVSFNGPTSLRWHLDHPLAEVPGAIEEETARNGISVWREDGWEQEFYDGYHTTFHTHEYVRDHWSRWLEVVAIHEAAAAPIQDIAVLRRR